MFSTTSTSSNGVSSSSSAAVDTLKRNVGMIPVLSKARQEALQQQEPKQFMDSPDRPSHYEYAVFSHQACQSDLGCEALPPGWRIYAIYSTSDTRLKCFQLSIQQDPKSKVHWAIVDKNKPLNLEKKTTPVTLKEDLLDSGYVGVAYIHDARQQIVLSHRGLSILNLGSLLGGLKVANNEINPQQVAALYAAQQCVRYALDNQYRFSVTGHGLGGWLAEITVYHCSEQDKPWFYRDMSAVTFDAPGSGEVMASMDSHLKDGRGVKREALDITHYVSIPNLINTCNEQVGTVYRITPDLPKRIGLAEYLMFNIDSHNMKHLLKVFDPKTGMPKFREQMLDWPRLDLGPTLAMLDKLKGMIGAGASAGSGSPTDILGAVTSGIQLLADGEFRRLLWGSIKALFKKDAKFPALVGGEYGEFHKYAGTEDYRPDTEALSFESNYFLEYSSHYKAIPDDAQQLCLVHFDAGVRRFLFLFDELRKKITEKELNEALSLLPEAGRKYLAAYKLDIPKNVISQEAEKETAMATTTVILLDLSLGAIYDFRRYVTHALSLEPTLLGNLEQINKGKEKAVRERLSLVHNEVSDLKTKVDHIHLVGMSDDRVGNIKEQVRANLKARYTAKEFIQGLFGKPFKLEGQYINVQMLYQIQKEDDAEKDRKIKNFEDKRMTSFEDLFGKKMALEIPQLFLPAKAVLKGNQKSTERDPNQAPRLLLLQGRAGIGKTTFVDYVSREWSKGRLWSQFEWVFVLRLRDLRENQFVKRYEEGETLSLREWIYTVHFSGKVLQLDFDALWEREIEPKLNTQVLIVLDGYDETPEQHSCKAALQELLNSTTPTIITSRPYGVTDLQSYNRRDLEVVGFVDENVKRYIQFYFEDKKEKGEQIISALQKNVALWGNAHIPVTLNILCGVLAQGEILEESLEELSTFSGLYGQMEIKLLERAYKASHEQEWRSRFKNLTPAKQQKLLEEHYNQHRRVLARLAFLALEAQQLVMTPQTLSDTIEAEGIGVAKESVFIDEVLQLGLLKPILGEDDIAGCIGYEFLHLTFQEYYAGRYIPWVLQDEKDLIKLLEKIKLNPRYQLVLWFAAGSLKQEPGKFKRFIELLQTTSPDLIGNYELGLLIRCTEEALELSEQLNILGSIIERLEKKLTYSWQACQQGIIIVEGHKHSTIPVATPVPTWLRLLQLSPKWQQSRALNILFSRLCVTNDSKNLAGFLGWLQLSSPFILELLVVLSKDEDKSEYGNVREAAAKAIGNLGAVAATPEILERLVTLSKDEVGDVRQAAASAIGKLGAGVVTPALLECLATLLKVGDRNTTNINMAAKAIGELGTAAATPEMLERLVTLSKDEEENVRQAAAEAIGNLGVAATPTLLDRLVALSKDEGGYVRQAAAEAIGNLGVAATPALLDRLVALSKDEEVGVRQYATQAIGDLGVAATSALLDRLVALSKDENSGVRLIAANVIRRLGTAAMPPALLDRLVALSKDEEVGVRLEPASAIGNLGAAASPELLQSLLALTKDEKEDVRREAAIAIGKLGATVTSELLQSLLILVKDESREVRWSADSALNALSSALASQNFQSLIKPNALNTILASAVLLAYFSTNTSLTFHWDGKQNYLKGFVDKDSFAIPLSLEQAKWCRKFGPVLVEKLHRLQFEDFFNLETLSADNKSKALTTVKVNKDLEIDSPDVTTPDLYKKNQPKKDNSQYDVDLSGTISSSQPVIAAPLLFSNLHHSPRSHHSPHSPHSPRSPRSPRTTNTSNAPQVREKKCCQCILQ